MIVFDDGTGPSLYVGGEFFVVDDEPWAPNIARWDGQDWHPLGDGTPIGSAVAGSVRDMLVHDDGAGPAMYIGGEFTHVPGRVAADGVARFDGQSWAGFGSGVGGNVNAIDFFNGELYAGGQFSLAAGAVGDFITRWDGQAWTDVGGGLDNTVMELAVFDDGTGPALYAGGFFGGRILKWDGLSWSLVGGPLGGPDQFDRVSAMAVFDDGSGPALYVAGIFAEVAGRTVPASCIAKWNGATWSAVGGGVNGHVQDLLVANDGEGTVLYAAGSFTSAGGQPASGIAKWDGQSWSALGTGIDATNGAVVAMDVYQGFLYAGGYLPAEGPNGPVGHIVRWGCAAVCAPDLDADTDVDVFDLLAYLDRWFASDASAELTGDDPVAIDVFDLLAYLDGWFAGC